MRAGGGVRAEREEEASGGPTGNDGGPHPLSLASLDSSPIEGERFIAPRFQLARRCGLLRAEQTHAQ